MRDQDPGRPASGAWQEARRALTEPQGRGAVSNDEMVLILLGLLAGGWFLTNIAPGLAARLGTWLVDQQILVTGPAAIFTIPGLHAGPDLTRIAIPLLLGVGIVLTRRRRRTSSRRKR